MKGVYVPTTEEYRDLVERSFSLFTYSKRDDPSSRAKRVRLVRAILADEDIEAVRVFDVCGRKQDGHVHIEELDVTVAREPEPRWWQFWRPQGK